MNKLSISLNKSYITKLLTDTVDSSKTINVIKPGYSPVNIIKPNLKQKTDRGEQLIAQSQFKKTLLNTKLQLNRLDVTLFFLKFTTSLSQSRHFIKQGFIKVNNKTIVNPNYLLQDFSFILCNNNLVFDNFILHNLCNIIDSPTNLNKLSGTKAVMYKEEKLVQLPKKIKVGLMRRMTVSNTRHETK